ncbi:MAG TPA: hypothetical protein VNV85_16020 [Puia sp.]|jgi:DNA repair exonuclease SbcCD ATPase subunit|nr:hypothetical protein [Puia sp.]
MKKNILLIIVVFAFKMTTYSQAQSYEGKLEYQKTMQQVAIIELPYKTSVVEDAIRDYLAKKGLKNSSSKGFDVFRGAKLDDADPEASDLYFKIERKRRDKDYTVISLLATKANQDILGRPLADSTGQIDKAKSFLNNLVPYVDAHNTEVQAGDQQEVLKKAQKKFDALVSDQTDIEKKIRRLQSDQDQNKSDIIKNTQDIQNTVTNDADVKNKMQKRMNRLLDQQDDLRKKLRKAQAELDENRINQENQQKEVDKQQQVLDAIKAKKTN